MPTRLRNLPERDVVLSDPRYAWQGGAPHALNIVAREYASEWHHEWQWSEHIRRRRLRLRCAVLVEDVNRNATYRPVVDRSQTCFPKGFVTLAFR